MIELKNLTKTYKTGKVAFTALKDVSLTINSGEFCAIMGPSGSGKSTLMHIIGFLDSPDSGSYKLNGRETADLTDDEYSGFRKNMIGFVFQQFHLLPKYDASSNIKLPLVYSGRVEREAEADRLLRMTGLTGKGKNLPGEMSGGERQRVAVARSLINDPEIILADEPTGNLDSKSGKEVMELFRALNKDGKTVILVTHDPETARYADRVIKVRDGMIVEDSKAPGTADTTTLKTGLPHVTAASIKGNVSEYVRQAVKTISGNKLRSFLSMLGIMIGVAAVISMLAIAAGAKASINERLSSLGSNLLVIRPGSSRSLGVTIDRPARFTQKDTELIGKVKGITAVSSYVSGSGQAVAGNKNMQVSVNGVDSAYAPMRAYETVQGRYFTDEDTLARNKHAVLGAAVANTLFPGENPVGKTVKINKVNFTVLGVLKEKGAGFGPGMGEDESVHMPVTTAMYRLLGRSYISVIYAQAESREATESVQEEILQSLKRRHKMQSEASKAFDIRNMAEMQDMIESTNKTLTVLLASIAAISLLVGGIGIMNIMLVSVKERTREIGLRKAIGATKKDILSQFVIEAVFLTFTGGASGVILGSAAAVIISLFSGWSVIITPQSVILSTTFSAFIGLAFGIWPAKQASELNPIDALRYE